MDRTVCAYACDDRVLHLHATVLPADKRFQMRRGTEAQGILTAENPAAA